MLVRFFKRDLADLLVKSKKVLKEQNLVLHEDTTAINKRLINDLNKRTDVESAWCQRGVIWAKMKEGGRKIRVGINYDINQKLCQRHPSSQAVTAKKRGPTPEKTTQNEATSIQSEITVQPQNNPASTSTSEPQKPPPDYHFLSNSNGSTKDGHLITSTANFMNSEIPEGIFDGQW